MAEVDKKTIAGVLAVLVASLGFNLSGFISSDFDNTWYCDKNSAVDMFKLNGRVSSTGYSWYPYEDSNSGYVRCGTSGNKGTWVKANTVFSKEEFLSLLEEESAINIGNQKKNPITEVCYVDGCVKVG